MAENATTVTQVLPSPCSKKLAASASFPQGKNAVATGTNILDLLSTYILHGKFTKKVIHWPLVWLLTVHNTPCGKLCFLTGWGISTVTAMPQSRLVFSSMAPPTVPLRGEVDDLSP